MEYETVFLRKKSYVDLSKDDVDLKEIKKQDELTWHQIYFIIGAVFVGCVLGTVFNLTYHV